MANRKINVTINGAAVQTEVDERTLLVHFLREQQDLTGTHIGCDTGHCGACTVDLDGCSVKSCMVLAVQADRPDVQRRLAMALVRAGDPEGTTLVEELLLENPGDQELEQYLGPGPYPPIEPSFDPFPARKEDTGDH